MKKKKMERLIRKLRLQVKYLEEVAIVESVETTNRIDESLDDIDQTLGFAMGRIRSLQSVEPSLQKFEVQMRGWVLDQIPEMKRSILGHVELRMEHLAKVHADIDQRLTASEGAIDAHDETLENHCKDLETREEGVQGSPSRIAHLEACIANIVEASHVQSSCHDDLERRLCDQSKSLEQHDVAITRLEAGS